jgi:hypothetical protein
VSGATRNGMTLDGLCVRRRLDTATLFELRPGLFGSGVKFGHESKQFLVLDCWGFGDTDVIDRISIPEQLHLPLWGDDRPFHGLDPERHFR